MTVLSTAATIGQAFKNAGRVREVVGVFVKHGYADLMYRMRLGRFLKKGEPQAHNAVLPGAVRLRLAFEALGPTFVKLGQLLATRPDLIPESFIEEFEKLQDNVQNVPFDDIKQIVEAELKCPLGDVFAEFETTPLAAASIAQVHGAVLKTGERVAVKVQRPGIEKIINNDVSILRGLAVALEKYVPESRPMNPVGLVEEFFKSILFELDFRIEANNIRRIKKNLAELEKISIPEVFNRISTEKLLVLERFDGLRFSDREAILAKGLDPSEIIRVGVDAFFHMVIKDGVFHGDLHGGNLFVLPDGKIGIIDFGIVGRLGRRVKDSVIIMFTAIIDEDYDSLASEYMNLCQITGPTDYAVLQKDLMDSISPYVGMQLGEVNVGRILLRSTSTASKHNLRVPRELMLLFRALLTIESLGKRLDPNFDLLPVGMRLARQTIAARYSKERVLSDLYIIGRDVQSMLEITPRLLKRFLNRWAQNNFAFEHRNKDIEILSRSVNRLGYTAAVSVLSLIWGAVAITSLVLNLGPELFGVPLLPILLLSAAIYPLLHTIWQLKKRLK